MATLRRELQRDAVTGRLPLAWDGDDWGQAAQAAWRDADPALRAALAVTLQDWLEGVSTKPSQRWQRALQASIAALEPGLAPAWRAWLLQTLLAFETCSGRIEWATTGARPGVLARLGDASENLLLGLLWWAWLDTAIESDRLQIILQRMAQGAWQRLPDVGARAPTVGGLALRMLAGLGEAARQAVASQALERGTPKQFKQAAQRALKEPLAR